MLNFFFGFKGRIRRSNYFFGALAAGLLWSVLGLSGAAAMGLRVDESLQDTVVTFDTNAGVIAVAVVTAFFALWALLALTVKRWHDVGVTGWFSILSTPPFANGVVFLILCLLPGTPGANRYGEDPRGRQALGATATA